jgi:hypothetical protein
MMRHSSAAKAKAAIPRGLHSPQGFGTGMGSFRY